MGVDREFVSATRRASPAGRVHEASEGGHTHVMVS